MAKNLRLEYLKNLVRNNELNSQKEIIDKFYEVYKIKIEQPTLSRDLKELDIKKGSDGYYRFGEMQQEIEDMLQFKSLLKRASVRLDTQTSIYALITDEGYATIVGTKLKDFFPDLVWGMIAQDNTLIILADDDFEDALNELL